MCQVTELLERAVHSRDGVLEEIDGASFATGCRDGETQLKRDGQQPLLGAIVQIAFETLADRVTRGHDPRP